MSYQKRMARKNVMRFCNINDMGKYHILNDEITVFF